MTGSTLSKEAIKVLIVESNAENEAQLKNIISPYYLVETAKPEDVFEILSDKKNDIATTIIDIRIAAPIVKKLRGIIPTSKFPVLISTDIDNAKQ